MVSSVRTSRSATLNEQLLIARLITSVVLALLLIFGAAVSAHTEQEGAASASLLLSGVIDPHIEPATDASAAPEVVVAGSSSGSSALVDAALCVFGILCWLTFMVVMRKLWRRRMSPVLGDAPRMRSLLPASAVRAHPVVLSLTQLSLSRT